MLRHGDLRFDFTASIRGLEGIRAHQRIQDQRPPHYQPEVTVSRMVDQDQWQLMLKGRIDGVMVESEQVIIEEIKTTRMPLDTLTPNPIHWGQAHCYAYMWAADHQREDVTIHLTYAHLDTGKARTWVRHFQMDELRPIFDQLVANYAQWLLALTQWMHLRDDAVRQLEFPFEAYRPGQREMAKSVYRTVRDGAHLLAQAATGIGKTMAALFPAIKAIPDGLTPKVVFLTARTTGRLAAEQALDQMRAKGLRIRSVTVTAKDKICFYPESDCMPDECPCAQGHYDRLNDALSEALTNEALTRTCVEALATRHQVCPFELTLELVDWADCVIGDYNYAFAPGVILQRLFGDEADRQAVLVDEAHNLVDRSREMFSAQLTKRTILSLRRALKETSPAMYKSLGRINAWMATTRRQCRQAADGVRVDIALPEKLAERVQEFLWCAEKWLVRNEKMELRADVLELYFTCARWMRVAECYDDHYVTTYKAENDELRVQLFCVDPSHRLRQAWENCQSAVLFSATLTPATYFQEVLGCSPETRRLNIPSPFPQENLAVFVDTRISTYYRDRERSCQAVSRSLEILVRHCQGHYLLFFPSYAYMDMIHQQFEHHCPDIRTMVQVRDMTESNREDFLNRFRTHGQGTLVGFAVLGGIFAEGIDLRGDHLTGAAIVGVGLPGICTERDVIRDYYNQKDGAGFEFAYQNPGFIRVLQAAGRVIRSKTDCGVVLLIDNRYGRRRYRSLFPVHWRMQSVHDQQSFNRQLSSFWGKRSRCE